MSSPDLHLEIDERGVATLTLNRPEKHNALNPALIAALTECAHDLDARADVRAVILTGRGDSFCAGGDLRWMQAMRDADRRTRIADSATLATLFNRLDQLSKPLIGRINGPAYGGGTGLIAVCDIAIATDSTRFALTEVKLGMAPANIAPFVVQKMGRRNARRCFLNAKPLSAAQAQDFNLIDEVVPAASLDLAIDAEIQSILRAGPAAIAATKALIDRVSAHERQAIAQYTAELLADLWETEEAQEGIAAFFERRPPHWHPKAEPNA